MSFLASSDSGGSNYVPNKYKNNASEFSSMVANVNGVLNSAISELNNVESKLSVNKAKSNDLLTFNVIAGNEEIKSEVSSVAADLDGYVTAVKTKAIELDNEEERIHREYLRRLKAKKEAEKAEQSEV